MLEAVFFYTFAIIAVVTAIGVVFFKNVMYSAMSVIGTMTALAVLYLMLHAHFVGVMQILVYAGAIIVLFLFVIQLLAQRDEDRAFTPKPLLLIGGVSAAVVLGSYAALSAIHYAPDKAKYIGVPFGTVASFSRTLFREHLLSFELAALLILAALVGAVVIAKRKV